MAACSPVEAERDFAGRELGIAADRLYSDFDAFVADPNLDAIVLVTPTSLHADQAIAVLKAGKHVFIEKPLALNLPDCEFEGGARAVFYASRTLAHGHETTTEVIGTAGKLLVGEHAAWDRVIRSDASGVGHAVLGDFHERFEAAFAHEMAAFVAACRGVAPLSLTLSDAMEATRIGLAITRSLQSGMPEAV